MTAFGFNQNDAKRIGRAVRVVERLGPSSETSGPQNSEVSRGVRLLLAKHEGSAGWAVGASAVVTVHNGSPIASAMTMVAYNQFLTMPPGTACTSRWVALGHNGWGWYAVAREPACTSTCSMTIAGIDFAALPNFDGGKIQLLGHSESGCLNWYSITTCAAT